MTHVRAAIVPLLLLAMFAPGRGRLDIILVQNGQYTGQYTGQYSGQSSGQWSGQATSRWSGQYLGQKAPPAPITLIPGPVDNRGDPDGSVDNRGVNTFTSPSATSSSPSTIPSSPTTGPTNTVPCWSVLNGAAACRTA